MTASDCRSLVQTSFDEEQFEALLSLEAFREEFVRVTSVAGAERCLTRGAVLLRREIADETFPFDS